MTKVSVTFRLAEDLDEWVRRQAEQHKVSLSRVVEVALRRQEKAEAEAREAPWSVWKMPSPRAPLHRRCRSAQFTELVYGGPRHDRPSPQP